MVVSAQKPMLSLDLTEQVEDQDQENMAESSTQYYRRLRFFFPILLLCQSSAPAAEHWRRLRSPEKGRWWPRKVDKFKEWSTGARRKVAASLSRIGCGNGKRKGLELLYDPESYALNFDRDAGHDRDWECPAFSLRFACPSRS